MATCSSYLLNHAQIKGRPLRMRIPTITERFSCPSKSQGRQALVIAQCSTSTSSCLVQVGAASPGISGTPFDPHSLSNFMHKKLLVVADLDPATAKLTIGFLGPFFSLFSLLFIIRIVMSWYPKIHVGKFPYVLAYAPTEPILGPTRKLIPPLGGVDVTPVVWFGLISFLNEILIGPQGLLVLLSQQASN